MDSGGFGALGMVLLPEMLVIANAENHLTEDGGNRITFVDRRTGSLRGTVESRGLARISVCGLPGALRPPYGPPRNLAVRAPDPGWGCFPDPNGLALGRPPMAAPMFSRQTAVPTSVRDRPRSCATRGPSCGDRSRSHPGRPLGHHRHPRQAAHHRGERRESAGWIRGQHDLLHRRRPGELRRGPRRSCPRPRRHGRSLGAEPSVDPLRHPRRPGSGRPERAREQRVDREIELALAGNPDAEVTRIPLVRPDGQPARPKGSAITSDGRYAVISGGPSSPPFSQELGHLYVIDLRSRRVVATVTGVGHEPYALAVVER